MMELKYGIFLRLTARETEKLKTDAKKCGLSMSVYLRRLIMGTQVRARPTEEIKKLRTEIHHIGNNINQVTRKINAGFGTKEDLELLTTLMEQVYRQMYEVAKE